MKTHLISIGNSRGIRIPKALLEESKLGEEVELSLEDNQIIISPATHPRQGWREAFQNIQKNVSNPEEVPFIANEWDETQWEW